MAEEEKEKKVESTGERFELDGEGIVQDVVTREVKKVEPETGEVVPWRYRHFVEGVATEKIAKEVGADPSKMARVFHKKDEGSDKDQVHVVGPPDVVKEIANGLEAPKRELHTWYIGEAETVEEERAAVKPALKQLIVEIPRPILSDVEIKEIATRVAHEALEETVKALDEFKQGGESNGKE